MRNRSRKLAGIMAALTVSAMALCMTAAAADSSADQSEAATEAAQSGAKTDASQTETDWLPIGTVVDISGQEKKFMILGRGVQNASDGKYYDYCACLYPDGYFGGVLYFFDRDRVGDVVYEGYDNEYEDAYVSGTLNRFDAKVLNGSSSETSEESEAASEAQSGTAAPQSESGQMQTGDGTSESGDEASSGSETEQSPESETEGKTASAYTVLENVHLRTEASTDADSLATVPAGRTVERDISRKDRDGWIPVKFTSDTGEVLEGWIKGEFLEAAAE